MNILVTDQGELEKRGHKAVHACIVDANLSDLNDSYYKKGEKVVCELTDSTVEAPKEPEGSETFSVSIEKMMSTEMLSERP